MKIALVGSSRITITPRISDEIWDLLDSLSPGDTLLIRSPNGQVATSAFEGTVWFMAKQRGFDVRMFSPYSPDRAENYNRDYRLVLSADEVIAYFPYGFDPEGGAWHVVHAAMQKAIPCRAYAITQAGAKSLIGSEDGPEPDWYGWEPGDDY